MMNDIPQWINDLRDMFKHISIVCVNLGIDRANVTDKNWIYFAEEDFTKKLNGTMTIQALSGTEIQIQIKKFKLAA